MYKCDLYTFIRLSKNRHRPDTPETPGKDHPRDHPREQTAPPQRIRKNHRMTVDEDKDEKKDDSDKDKKDML